MICFWTTTVSVLLLRNVRVVVAAERSLIARPVGDVDLTPRHNY